MKIKKVTNPFICFLIILMICSCSNQLFLQRKYTKGRYFAHRNELKSLEIKSPIAYRSIAENQVQSIQPQINTITDSIQNTQLILKNTSKTNADYEVKKPIQLLQPLGKQMQIGNAKVLKKNSHQYFSKESAFLKSIGAWTLSQLSVLCLIPAVEIIDLASVTTLSSIFFPAAILILGFLLALKSFKMASSVLQADSGFLSKLVSIYALVNSISVLFIAIIILIAFIVLLII